MNADIIVIGSGISGLFSAIQIAEKRQDLSIAVLTKTQIDNSNTWFAQGGIAVVTNSVKDSFEKHIEDTLKSGGGLSDINIVKLVVETAPARLKELVNYGVHFTLTDNGDFDLALEGGHSTSRVVHAFDNTGQHLIKALIPKAQSFDNITFYENRYCHELLKKEDGSIGGVSVLNTITKELELFKSNTIILATGGAGQVYKNTTNPEIASGDGIAMGIKIGAAVSNLNFVQFHPTALYEEGKDQLFLLTEAIRGSGGHIVNKKGERFVFKHDKRGELATRDIVSTAIFTELKESGEPFVYLDCRHISKDKFQKEFPEIDKKLRSKNLNPQTDLIPVVPAAHYQCGGLKVNQYGQTGINGLYAIGECAETGLHGSNRLASNSLLEGLVFAHETAKIISQNFSSEIGKNDLILNPIQIKNDKDELFHEIIEKIQKVMSENGTIASNEDDLKVAKKELDRLQQKLVDEHALNYLSEAALTAQNLLINATEIILHKQQYFSNQTIKS